jgi:hypothetical protein
MVKQYHSEHLRIVIQAYRELKITVAHRSKIIHKWREIRMREGLEPISDNWVDYVFHAYPEFFRSVRKGSGIWEYLE